MEGLRRGNVGKVLRRVRVQQLMAEAVQVAHRLRAIVYRRPAIPGNVRC